MRKDRRMKQNPRIKKKVPRGQMKPLTPDQVGAIETILKAKLDFRSLALFRLAIDTMLRASDLVALRWATVLDASGGVLPEIITGQQKTNEAVRSSLSDATRDAVTKWRAMQPSACSAYVFAGKLPNEHLSASQYRRDAKIWFRSTHLDTRFYSTHSLRRTKAALIYEKTGNVEIVRRLLGHRSIEATSLYLGVGDADAMRIAREIKI
jgi:integrase